MKAKSKQLLIILLSVFIFSMALAVHAWSGRSPSHGETPDSGEEAEAGADPAEAPDLSAGEIHSTQAEQEDKVSEIWPSSEIKAAAGEVRAAEKSPSKGPDTDKKQEISSSAAPGEDKQENAKPDSDVSPPPPEPAQPAPERPVSPSDTILNDYVQEVIASYSGYYPYLLNNDYTNYNGVTENLYFQNRLLARAHPSGNRASHCVGITFEVFFKAMQERNRRLGLGKDDFNGMTYADLHDFLLIWYVASGSKQTNNIELAVEKYGIGKRITRFADAKTGDFMDISRSNGTGHTVIFQNWVRDSSGNIVGVHYWSSQRSGIGLNTEYFDTSGRGNVYYHQVYIARVLPVHQFRSFR